MARVELDYKVRENFGRKSLAKKIRDSGFIPAICYGFQQDTLNIQIEEKYFTQNLKSMVGKIILLKSEGKEDISCFIKSIDRHPVTGRIIHVDFLGFKDENRHLKIDVTVNFVNRDKCVGTKMGGHLNMVKRRIKVIGKPSNIPRYIPVDVKDLYIGSSVRLSDIKEIEGVSFVDKKKDIVIATIVGRRKRVDPNATEASTNEKENSA